MRLSSLSALWWVFVSELTEFNNTVWNLLTMKSACTEPPPVKTSNDKCYSAEIETPVASLSRGTMLVLQCHALRLFCALHLQNSLAFARK